jgi:hypothetical protein
MSEPIVSKTGLFPEAAARLERERVETLAKNAEMIRRREVDAWLRERAAVEQRREQLLADEFEPRLIVVDEHGKDTGLRAVKESAADQRRRRDERVRHLDAELEIVERELKARGYGQ